MSSELQFHIEGGVATITLNRPDKRNAYTDEMLEEWLKALAEYRAVTANRYLDFAQIAPQAAELLYVAGQKEPGLAVAEAAAKDYPDSIAAWTVFAILAMTWTMRGCLAEAVDPMDGAVEAARLRLIEPILPGRRAPMMLLAAQPSR